jgi:hypothetical protein
VSEVEGNPLFPTCIVAVGAQPVPGPPGPIRNHKKAPATNAGASVFQLLVIVFWVPVFWVFASPFSSCIQIHVHQSMSANLPH